MNSAIDESVGAPTVGEFPLRATADRNSRNVVKCLWLRVFFFFWSGRILVGDLIVRFIARRGCRTWGDALSFVCYV
jgi:hypothetical protein